MMTMWRLVAVIVSLAAFPARPGISHAEIQAQSAASYIRGLFDTSMRSRPVPAQLCPAIAQFGRSAAGHTWRTLADEQRRHLADGFCTLAVDAVTRLQASYPNLHLKIERILPGPQGTMIVASSIQVADDAMPWPVDWQIAEAGTGLRVSDMRVLGLSLGIFLRSLAVLSAPADATATPDAEGILTHWRQALNRVLPRHPGPPPHHPK